MVNHERNYKTLIICFVIALVALVPLRFVEEGNKPIYEPREQVLGDEVMVVTKEEILADEMEVEEVFEEVVEEEIVEDFVEEVIEEEKKLNIILPDSDIQYLIERVY